MTNGKRSFGRWTQIFEKINFYTIGRENISRNFSKQTAVVATIVTNYHTYLRHIGKLRNKIIAQTLSSCAYSVNIHTVCAGAHNATQTSCTKFQIAIERFNQLGFVLSIHHSADIAFCFFVVIAIKPCLCFGHYFI